MHPPRHRLLVGRIFAQSSFLVFLRTLLSRWSLYPAPSQHGTLCPEKAAHLSHLSFYRHLYRDHKPIFLESSFWISISLRSFLLCFPLLSSFHRIHSYPSVYTSLLVIPFHSCLFIYLYNCFAISCVCYSVQGLASQSCCSSLVIDCRSTIWLIGFGVSFAYGQLHTSQACLKCPDYSG